MVVLVTDRSYVIACYGNRRLWFLGHYNPPNYSWARDVSDALLMTEETARVRLAKVVELFPSAFVKGR